MDKISALMDGELDAQQARAQWARLKQDPDGLQHWDTFHLIGDTLRGEPIVLPRDFNARLAARLDNEPTVLAPRQSRVKRVTAYALSAAASLSAVALVGWVAFVSNPLAPPELAKAPVAPAPAAAPVTQAQIASVPNEGRMNDFLIAHQEFSPSTAIQGLAPYIRSVSSAQQGRGR